MSSRLSLALSTAALSTAGVLLVTTAHAAGEVRLIRAESSEIYAEGLTSQSVSYDISVENLAYAKNVVVYGRDANGVWSQLAAHYVESAPGGATELWEAEAQYSLYGAARGAPHDLEFAIAYTVNNATYWDNNGGKNYLLGADDGALLGPSTEVLLDYAYAGGQFAGEIDVTNLAYEKLVSVVYTTDGWATQHVAPASFFGQRATGPSDSDTVPSPNPEGVERWIFSVPSVAAAKVEFAVSYTVNGVTYWDNNFGRNYIATSAGAMPGRGGT